MTNRKQYKIEDIKNLIESVERVEGDSILTDIYGNKIDILEATAQADSDIAKIQAANVHFRWTLKEIERAKKIAEAKGLKYQAYIKSVLKQQMDIDEIVIEKSFYGYRTAKLGKSPAKSSTATSHKYRVLKLKKVI